MFNRLPDFGAIQANLKPMRLIKNPWSLVATTGLTAGLLASRVLKWEDERNNKMLSVAPPMPSKKESATKS